MMEESTWRKLISNTPLALIIIGVFLFLTGAAGGWPSLSLEVSELGWRVALAIMGAVVAGIGIGQFLQSTKSERISKDKDYSIKITSPMHGQIVPLGDCEIFGSYKDWPPEHNVKLFVIDRSNQYWVQSTTILRNEKEKTWHSRVIIGGISGHQTTIMIAIIGKGGQAICEYYKRVKEQTKVSIGISIMPPDLYECDRVIVGKR